MAALGIEDMIRHQARAQARADAAMDDYYHLLGLHRLRELARQLEQADRSDFDDDDDCGGHGNFRPHLRSVQRAIQRRGGK